MAIKYPEKLVCPNCTESLELDLSHETIRTNDLIAVSLNVPYAGASGKDFISENQSLGRRTIRILACVKCGEIIASMGQIYL